MRKYHCFSKTYFKEHLTLWYDTIAWELIPGIEIHNYTFFYAIRFKFLCFGITVRIFKSRK